MEHRHYFEEAIAKLKAEPRYRVFAELGGDARRIPFAEPKDVEVLHGDAARCTYSDLKRAAG